MNDILVKTEGIISVAACDDDGSQMKKMANDAPLNNKQIICLESCKAFEQKCDMV